MASLYSLAKAELLQDFTQRFERDVLIGSSGEDLSES
jgi:hypothetical protein